MMSRETLRSWAVRYTYAGIAAHLLVGALLPLMMNAALFDGYHRAIETAFWGANVPAAARAQQVWWISLFGPTVQAAAVWMGALAWIGDRQRNAFAWGALIAGIVLWAPQDILISMSANCWSHVWIDIIAVVLLLPPLVYLFQVDRAGKVLA
jgi:hypothetical protein